MRIIDRYLVRQFLPPFVLGLLVFTFLVIIPSLIQYAEPLIAKGVDGTVVVSLLALLVPHALALALPMSLLLGLLVALGRLSADREFVAMQACGISLSRLLRPVSVLALVGWALTSYVLIVTVPAANQAFREITFSIIAERAEGDVRPRVFFDGFPNLTLYVRDVPATGGWHGVFLADDRPGHLQAAYFARHGQMVIDREARTVQMVLEQGSRHAAHDAGKYEVFRFERLVLGVDPDTVFPAAGPAKGDNEMTLAELRTRIAELEAVGLPSHNARMAMHRRFSIPFACVVFALIGLALGASNRRDGTLGGFVVGLVVIFAYYIPLYLGPALAKGALVEPWMAVWLPNVVFGLVGILLLVRRDRLADRPLLRVRVPDVLRRQAGGTRGAPGLLLPLPGVPLLDRYVIATYLRVVLLAGGGMMAIFYISTFIDLSDKLFKGETTLAALAQYFWYATPQFVYYTVPMSVLLATIVTIAILTRSSELIVMKACGISLYRMALPMLAASVVAGGSLFALQETILGPANRQADALRHTIRGHAPETFAVIDRRWVAGTGGEIYHYQQYDPRRAQLTGLSVYEPADGLDGLARRTWASRATWLGTPKGLPADTWQVEEGWMREFDAQGDPGAYTVFGAREATLEPASYFETEQPDARYMSYAQLRAHTAQLASGGVDVLEQQVALARKLAFPFVTVVMTLIAIPFAVTTGRRGTMAGIGVGLALALAYWTTLSIFGAIGAGGLLAPTLAAWSPNLIFAAGAASLLLTVRT